MKLVWAADFYRVDEAFAFEKRIAGWRRDKKIALIEGRWEDLPGLARRYKRSVFPDDDPSAAE